MTSIEDVTAELAREPLRHVVLLKQLLAYPRDVTVHRATGPEGAATLVALQTAASPYDRQAYPGATVAAFIESDHPRLTASLMPRVPTGVGIVFKLSSEADRAVVESRFAVTRRTAFISFTSGDGAEPDDGVRLTSSPDAAAFALFETQGHDRTWLEPLLRSGRAFAAMLERDGETLSACIAFESCGPVWEVGGVVTLSSQRRRGLGARVVATALAELARRGLAPRYQVEERNQPSIRLAQSVGLTPFLTIVHYAHQC